MLTELPERPRHLMPGKHRCPRTPLAFCEIQANWQTAFNRTRAGDGVKFVIDPRPEASR